MTPQEFISQVWPYAVNAGQQTGIDPRVIVAQSALETGWGKSVPGNNYFGIKGPGGTYTTKEYIDGKLQTVTDSFSSYANIGQSFQGYADFMNKYSRYDGVQNGTSVDQQIAALGKSGYATDPNYSSKLSSIVDTVQKYVPADSTLGQLSGLVGQGLDGFFSPIPGMGLSDIWSLGSDAATEVKTTTRGWVEAILEFFSKETLIRGVAIVLGLVFITAAVAVLVTGSKVSTLVRKATA